MFEGKVALVTGASRGIGRAVALMLGSKGAYVIVNYAGSKHAAEEVVNEIVEAGGNAETYQCDVSSYEAVREMIEHIIKEKKSIDVIVNNAGITRDNLLLRMSEAEFNEVINTNLKGTFNVCKNAVRYMLKKRSGSIVNMTSVVGLSGNTGQANYAASKAGVIGFTKSMAKEVAAKGIRVNAVAPGFIQTDMTDILSDQVKEDMLSSLPMKRAGEPSDIAKAVCFLASEEAGYITGQVLQVDGGMNI